MSQKTATKRAVSRKDMTKAQWTWKEMKRNKVAYLMIAPYMIIFSLFTLIPVLLSMILSFTDFNMLEMPTRFNLDNYIRLFLDDDIFITALKNTFIFAVIVGPASYIMSFMVAWFINELSPKIRAVVTLIFYAPSISGQVYLVWGTLFSADSYGWANATLMDLGFITSPILWFDNASYVMPLCIVVALWTSLGTAFLSFIAGLQTIDRSMYEAAAVDGIKNRWQELWFVTLPSMKPQLMFGAVLTISGSLGVGATMAGNPSTEYTAYFMSMHMSSFASERYEMGYASAIATIMFLIMIVCNKLFRKVLSKIGS
jgi:multiple sugar transport system permease protein